MPPIKKQNGDHQAPVSDETEVSPKCPSIRIAVCMPEQCYDRETKLLWLEYALERTECDLFLTPQEYFGGHYIMKNDLHMERQWMLDKVGDIARRQNTCLGVGACVKDTNKGATEDYMYFSSGGEFIGSHSKFALPSYDDMRTGGHGQLWPETNFMRRATPVEIPELRLRVGTVFCWEVFSQMLFPAYSFARVNLLAHPIKFAPTGWLNNKKLDDGKLHIVGFGNAPKSEIWKSRLVMGSKHQVMCPIAVSCNSWNLGGDFKALVGLVDEMRSRTDLRDVPSVGCKEHIQTFTMVPEYYEGLDHHHSAGAFVAHTGSIDGYHELGEWVMHAKMRRLEAHLIGDTARMDCILKATAKDRQKQSTKKRAFGGLQRVRRSKKNYEP